MENNSMNQSQIKMKSFNVIIPSRGQSIDDMFNGWVEAQPRLINVVDTNLTTTPLKSFKQDNFISLLVVFYTEGKNKE